jgi:hypothetical protein
LGKTDRSSPPSPSPLLPSYRRRAERTRAAGRRRPSADAVIRWQIPRRCARAEPVDRIF